jgi:hypothetical protein
VKQVWTDDELLEDFTLNTNEWDWLSKRTGHNQLGLAVLLKTFQYEGRFPDKKRTIPAVIVDHIAIQLGLPPKLFDHYQWQGRTAYSDRQLVRDRLGFRETSVEDSEQLANWLSQHPILQQDQQTLSLLTVLYEQCRILKLEPPTKSRLERIARSGLYQYEQGFFERTWKQLSATTCSALDNLLYVDESIPGEDEFRTPFGWLKKDPGQVSVRSVQATADRLRRLQSVELPPTLFANTAQRVVKMYAQRAATERPYELRRHSQAVRFTLLAAFCWVRQQEITDCGGGR